VIDEVVSRGMGGRVEVSEKDGLASERGGGAGGGLGTAADGTVKAKVKLRLTRCWPRRR